MIVDTKPPTGIAGHGRAAARPRAAPRSGQRPPTPIRHHRPMSPAPTPAALPFDITGHLGDPGDIGNPEDLVGPDEAARVTRLQPPLPDALLQRAEPADGGHLQWRRRTLWLYALTQAIPFDDTGDPDELIGTAAAARVLHRQSGTAPAGLLEVAIIERNPDNSIKNRRWPRATVWLYALTELAVGATVLDGQLYLDRTGIAALAGVTIGHVDKWIKAAGTNGFPDRRDGRWYNAQQIQDWRASQLASQQPDRLVDAGGDPDELLTKAQILRMLGYTNPHALNNSQTWQRLLAANNPQDNVDDTPRGRRWPRRIALDIHNNPLPRGRTPGSTMLNRVVDLSGDPDADISSAEAARRFGYSHVSSLPQHVLDAADEVEYNPDNSIRARRWKLATLTRLADTSPAE